MKDFSATALKDFSATALDNCDVPGGVENGVEEAGGLWSDSFMRKMGAYLAAEKGRARAVPPLVGLQRWLEPVDPGTLCIRRECGHSDSGAHPISEARMTKLVEEQHGAGRV